MPRRIAYLDVFCDRPLAGNGLAVVDDADDVSDDVMLAFAMETRLSETTFVQTPSEGDADYRNRIWTPGEELPFAGHPSLGTAVAVARWREAPEADFVQQTGAGVQPIRVSRTDEGIERWSAEMRLAETAFGAELDAESALAAAGIDPSDRHPEFPPQVVSTGVAHVIVPLASAEFLVRAQPDYDAIDALLAPHDAVVLYLAAWEDAGTEQLAVRARGFTRSAAIGEDPATGSAAGPLCAYLHQRGAGSRIEISQGVEMGRPSTLHAEIDDEGYARVSGTVMPIVDGTVELPQ